MSLQYRRDIDGLRAVAVLPVILFHAGFEIFSGGFVGVDVFFVISGYLITSIIIREIQEDQFSLLTFYERRIRRILPALAVVVICSSIMAWFVLIPADMKDFSQSVLAVATFSSNIFFWQESGYFSTNAELKPLLHTWSLAVEEQFYILVPLFLLVTWQLGFRVVLWVFSVIFVLSLGLAHWGAYNMPTANYYLLPTRAWELMIGSFAAFYLQHRSVTTPNWINDLLSAVGLGAILFSVFVFDFETPFPSLYALLPTIGTVAIILFASPTTWVNILLSKQILVGIGLISYSTYLWHQPLYAFWRHANRETISLSTSIFLITATFVLAYLTYRFVETPFRRRQGGILRSPRRLLLSSGAMLFGLAVFGITGHLQNGWKSRLTDHQKQIIALGQPVYFACPDTSHCRIGSTTDTPADIALIGDSHMGRYAVPIDKHMRDLRRSGYLVEGRLCAPLLDFSNTSATRCGREARATFEAKFRSILENQEVETVVLAAQWAIYATGYRDPSSPIAYDYSGDEAINTNVSKNREEFHKALVHTLDLLLKAGKNIIIVGPVPEYSFRIPPELLRNDWVGGDKTSLLQSRHEYEMRNADVFNAFRAFEDSFNFIDVSEVLCSRDICRPYTDAGFPMYNDAYHLSQPGLDLVAPLILRQLAQLTKDNY